jgi:hypothetical protein
MARRYRINDNLINMTDIEIFNSVRSGAFHTFPRDYWKGVDSIGTAKEITKYLFENILKWSLDDIKNNPLSEVFYDNRLGSMVRTLFDNSVIKAVLNAYPELEEDLKPREVNGNNEDSDDESKTTRTLYTDEELIEMLQNKAKELGRNPYIREMKNPESSAYISRFSSWEKALIAADLLEDIYENVDISEEAEINTKHTLKEFVIENDRMPTEEEVESLISQGEVKTYFGSITGLYDYLESEYTKDELKEIMIKKYKKLGRKPVGRDMITPRGIVFIDKFDSWEEAYKYAEIIK